MVFVPALTLADAQLLVSVSKAIVNHPNDVSRVITPLIALSKSPDVSFTSSANLLRLLVTYTSPVAVPVHEISSLAHSLLDPSSATELSENDLIEDVENSVTWLAKEFQAAVEVPEDAILQIAKDLQISLATKAQLLHFNMSAGSVDSESLLFSFAKAKCLQMSAYYDNITEVAEAFEYLKSYAPFKAWLHGIILPYNYFHQNYAAPSDTAAPESAYLSLDSYYDIFDFFSSPLKSLDESLASKLSPRTYFSNVILPLAVYHSNDLDPVSAWMLQNFPNCDSLNDFEVWDEVVKTVLTFHNYNEDSFPITSYDKLVRQYVYACLYFGLYTGEKLTSVAQAKIQEKIKETLSYLVEILGSANGEILLRPEELQFPTFSNLAEFIESPPKFVNLIVNNDLKEFITYTLEVFSTCCALHSLNDLTVRKFFTLKSKASLSSNWFHKEVMRIFASADTQNYDQTMGALEVFTKSFLSQNTEITRELDLLVFENLLQTENFDKAIEYFNNLSDGRRLPTDVAFQSVSRKFWDLFENASNLDDRLGKLKLANSCLDVLDTLARQGELTEESRASVVKIKHLLKAIHSLKNFKLVIVRNEPVTPKQILNKVTSSSGEQKYPQFSIIALVLEQNPKSYLAHERLHKIVNDLAIYADLDVSGVSFPKIQSACVESALIDGNFDFAYKQTKALITYYVDTNNTDNFNEIWLMFYQVGKYISPDWFGDYETKVQEEKIGILLKQREILSLAIKYTKPNAFAADNSRLLVGQFRHVNQEIKKWHEDADLHRSDEVQDAFQSTQKQIQENITGFINEASHSKNQASEKISSLFVSGLGWAIGAKR